MSGRVPYQPHGSAIYRREMSVRPTEDGAVGEIVDDFHHFRARVTCDGDTVRDVIAESVRPPWSTCAEAEVEIKRLGGMRLDRSLRAAGRHTPVRAQCTHMFDAAALAIARLARPPADVTYSIAIPDRIDGRTRASLARDGEPVLDWELLDNEIVGPGPFAGRRIVGRQLADWAEASLDDDGIEATLLLQRACVISEGRRIDLEAYSRAQDVPGGPVGACHTYAPGNLERAVRVVGSVRNLTQVQGRLADQD
ncbi:MAG: DUF2889 domain-containing protein [Deltaproteobacteria bacterium]|nr:DUF2889 domain-containing protein [Deltaproteobacteria bacterium]